MLQKRRSAEQRKSQIDSSDRRGSYEGAAKPTSTKKDELERQRSQIMHRTKLSLAEIRNFYEEQRRQIEFELHKRRLVREVKKDKSIDKCISPKQHTNILSPHPLSEGPLSTEPDSNKSSPLDFHRSQAPLDESNSSQKESSVSSNNNVDYVDNVNVRIRELELNMRKERFQRTTTVSEALNKTSSSGTTTSSSNATAELLSRLRRMEMPTLSAPPPEFWQQHRQILGKDTGKTDSQPNTSTDIPKTKDIDKIGEENHQKAIIEKQIKEQQTLGEKERKRAEQSLGTSVTASFSSFHLSEQEYLAQISEEYSSISLSSDDSENQRLS